MNTLVNIVTGTYLEPWDRTTPWTTGIGGSETSQIEMTERLLARGHNVVSYCPLPKKIKKGSWRHSGYFVKDHFLLGKPKPDQRIITINYRSLELFDLPKRPNEKRWFISQDVDYPGVVNPSRLATIDRYVCLCDKHARTIKARYPMIADRVIKSSNGVRSKYIKELVTWGKVPQRVPRRMLFPSSPDRGLLFLLQNWPRILERFPDATLHVCYGMNNLNKVIDLNPKDVGRVELRDRLIPLLNQKGITNLGRINQEQLYKEWFEASVFPYPSDFPETNMITIQDAMACGAIPVTTNYWAQGEWSRACPFAYTIDGLPQKSEVVRGQYLNALYKALEFDLKHEDRVEMMQWARESFDWDNAVEQWEHWIQKDSQ